MKVVRICSAFLLLSTLAAVALLSLRDSASNYDGGKRGKKK